MLYPSGVCATVTKKITLRDFENLGAWFEKSRCVIWSTHAPRIFCSCSDTHCCLVQASFFVLSCKKNSQSEGLREAREALAFHQFRWSEWGQRRKETEEKVSPHSPFIKRRKRKRRKRGMGSARACVRTRFWRYALSTSPPLIFIFLIFFEEKGIFSVRNPKVVV